MSSSGFSAAASMLGVVGEVLLSCSRQIGVVLIGSLECCNGCQAGHRTAALCAACSHVIQLRRQRFSAAEQQQRDARARVVVLCGNDPMGQRLQTKKKRNRMTVLSAGMGASRTRTPHTRTPSSDHMPHSKKRKKTSTKKRSKNVLLHPLLPEGAKQVTAFFSTIFQKKKLFLLGGLCGGSTHPHNDALQLSMRGGGGLRRARRSLHSRLLKVWKLNRELHVQCPRKN